MDAERQAVGADARAAAAEKRAETAEREAATKADEADARAFQAEALAADAEGRLHDAEERLREAEERLRGKQHGEQGNAVRRATEAEQRAADASALAESYKLQLQEAERRIGTLERVVERAAGALRAAPGNWTPTRTNRDTTSSGTPDTRSSASSRHSVSAAEVLRELWEKAHELVHAVYTEVEDCLCGIIMDTSEEGSGWGTDSTRGAAGPDRSQKVRDAKKRCQQASAWMERADELANLDTLYETQVDLFERPGQRGRARVDRLVKNLVEVERQALALREDVARGQQ